jgi:hypothetical protein
MQAWQLRIHSPTRGCLQAGRQEKGAPGSQVVTQLEVKKVTVPYLIGPSTVEKAGVA